MIEEIQKYYRVYNNGDVFSFRRPRVLKPKIDRYGYKTVVLMLGLLRKNITVHRLVALFYVPNPDNFPIVNHKDGNKLNNHHTNLEWCTNAYNIQHAYDNGFATAWNKGKTGIYTKELIASMIKNQLNRKPVISKNIKTGEVQAFDSTGVMCREKNFDYRTAMRVLKGEQSYNTIKGHKLFYS